MNAPAFTVPCGAMSSRSTFVGKTVTRQPTWTRVNAPRARPAYLYPSMIGEAPTMEEGAGEEAATMEEEMPLPTPLADALDEVEAQSAFELDDEDDEPVEPCSPPQYVLNAEAIAEARAKFKLHETDTGSPEYQIATLTTRITYLTKHLKEHSKDFSTTRGLLKMVSTRRRLLKYLKRQDPKRFEAIIAGLGIRVSQQLRQI